MDNHKDCCCGHDHNYEEHFMKIITEDNQELKCSVLDIFEVEDKEYIALLPVGSDEVLLYQYIEFEQQNQENPEFELKNIETDEEFEKVEDAFFNIFNEDLFEDIDEEELQNF